jgi:hypothetical protein
VIEIPSAAETQCSAEKFFRFDHRLRGQDRWLTTSSAFHGTTEVSSNPVILGTTYREPRPFGVRNGTVTEFERLTKITFRQPMTMKLRLGTVDVLMRHTLTPAPGSTCVGRVVTLGIPWSLRLVQPLLVRAFRVESGRTLPAVKAYADKLC